MSYIQHLYHMHKLDTSNSSSTGFCSHLDPTLGSTQDNLELSSSLALEIHHLYLLHLHTVTVSSSHIPRSNLLYSTLPYSLAQTPSNTDIFVFLCELQVRNALHFHKYQTLFPGPAPQSPSFFSPHPNISV
uniref:Uncharacterized protein n=1 Tax=Opuntia streptacantha TaxID=393608 RepID=A0A7C9EPZ2_OPUST